MRMKLRLVPFVLIITCAEILSVQSRIQEGLSLPLELPAIDKLISNPGSRIKAIGDTISSRRSLQVSPQQDDLLSGMVEIGPTLTSTNKRLPEVLPGVLTGAGGSLDLGSKTIQLDSKSIAAVSNFVPIAEKVLKQEIALDENAFKSKIDKPNLESVGWGPQFLTDPEAIEISINAEVMIEASKKAVDTAVKSKTLSISPSASLGRRLPEKLNFRHEVKGILEKISPRIPVIGTKLCTFNAPINCDFNTKYRTADGSCNNKKNRIWGRSLTPFERFIFPMYEDGINSPRTLDINGAPLPGSRKISTEIHQKSSPSTLDNLAHFAMEYGQFISHDIQMNALSKGRYMSNLDCCAISKRRNCFPIKIPKDDPFFGQSHIKRTCMNFVRSLSTPGLDCKLGVRQQMNQVTHYLDGSAVYGSKKSVMDSLRLKKDGLLKSSEGGKLLPKEMSRRATCRLPSSNSRIKCFQAGDVRVNQQPALISLHTIWMREHNRIAKLLKASNPGWNDEKLFQEARKIVGAEIQHITYNEYLKKILGPDIMNTFDLNPKTSGYFTGYTERAKPMIRNVFMAAAYRFGHSMIDRKFAFHPPTSPNFNSDLRNVMLRPDWIYRNKGVSSVTRGLYETSSQKVDRLMTWEVTRHLFERSTGTGMDLAATNIQRGRDHGIASYNVWRDLCGLPVVDNFNVGVPGGLNDHDVTTAARLEKLYASVDDIDLFTAGVSETNLPGAKVGPTFACLIGIQFKALKYGDRFFYESNTDVKLPLNLLDEIRSTSMAKIICDNTDISQIPRDVFLKSSSSSSKVPCSSLKGFTLCINGGWSNWKRRGCMETRKCTNPRPSKCGKKCKGEFFRSKCSLNIFDTILMKKPTLDPRIDLRPIRLSI